MIELAVNGINYDNNLVSGGCRSHLDFVDVGTNFVCCSFSR